MRNESTSNMDFEEKNSSFDSEAEDLEMRMYSELYFEPNPGYVPLKCINDQDTIVQSKYFFNSESPVSDLDGLTVLSSGHKGTTTVFSRNGPSSNNNYLTAEVVSNSKVSQRETGPNRPTRAQLTSNSSSIQSIPGSVVLDRLYCSSNSPIPEENNESVDETEVKVTKWIQSNNSIASQIGPCNRKTATARQGSQQMKEIDNLIVIDDSSSDANDYESGSSYPNNLSKTNNNTIQIPIKQCNYKNRAQNSSNLTPFKHDTKSKCVEEQGTLLDVIKKLMNSKNLTAKKGKCDRPGTRKKLNRRNKASRSLTEFTADLSGESDAEITGFGNSSTLLTNLSINCTESLRNNPVERVYGITCGEDEVDEPSKKRFKKIRTHWPTDYTADKSLRDRVPPLPHWTPHMTAFYETDFSDEFDLEDIHKQMPSSVIEWDLEEDDLPYSVLRRQQSDRRATPRQRQRYFRSNDRCERCRSYDHITSECSKLEHCHLCGNTGHSSKESCPSNICLRCGEGVHTFCEKTTLWSKCDLCNQKGHIQDLCPDVWRRFCFTTSGSTPLAPSNSRSSFNVPDRLSCFSCGQPGHLGPDCQYRVPNYVVLSYDVMSFDLPTQNLLGKTILRQVVPSAWDTAEEMEVCSQYGEDVTVHTPSRASVLLRSGSAGLVIGKAGVVINTLKRISGCTLSVSNNGRGMDELWVSGENIDPVIRAVLFFFLKVNTNIEGLDVYSSALEAATGHGLYDKAYRKEVARLRAEYSRQKQQERYDLQALNKKTAMKAVKAPMVKASSENVVHKTFGHGVTNGRTDVVCVSDSDDSSDESDVQIIDGKERLVPSRGSLSIQSKASVNFPNPSDKNIMKKRIANGIQRSTNKLKGINEDLKTESENCSSDANFDSKSVFIDRILSYKKNKNNQSMEEQLTNSENSDSSDLDSAMEDYADNCIMNSDSDTDISSEVSDEDDTSTSDDSGEVSLSDEERSRVDIDCEGHYNLVLKDKMLTAIMHKKLARNKTLVQMLPEGRISLIATIKGKLAELYNLHVDVKGTLEQLKKDCAEQNRIRSASSLWSLQEGLKLLATYVLGTKRLGHGRALVKLLMHKLASLEASKESRIAIDEREKIAKILLGLFEVDESSLATIARYALTLVKRKGRGGKSMLESTPKQPMRSGTSYTRGFSSFTEDRGAISRRKKTKNHSLIDRLRYPSTFFSLNEKDQFNDTDFLCKDSESFTRSPRTKKLNSSRERKFNFWSPFDGRLEYPSPFGGRPQTTTRSSSKSPRTFKSKSPKRLVANFPGRSVKRKSSKSPRMKWNQTSDSRAKTRGKGSRSSRTKFKSAGRRK